MKNPELMSKNELRREVIELRHRLENENTRRFQYAGAIGLLCEASVQVDEETRECIEMAVADFCKLTGWTSRRTLNRIEVEPPETSHD